MDTVNPSTVDILIEMQEADLTLRDKLLKAGKLEDGYNEEMETLHNNNAAKLSDIIDSIGYPTVQKVGEEASHAAWLIVQHAIAQPNFMRKCAKLLEVAVESNQADPVQLAYLSDRVAVLEGRLQRYGTQFDFDSNGLLSPQPYDDLSEVNQRRSMLGLNSLEDQTQAIRKRDGQAKSRSHSAYSNMKKKYDLWRKSVGWI